MANVVIKFKGDLCKKLQNNERALTQLAVDFESERIIASADLTEVKRMKGMDGASHLLTLVCDEIRESGSDCLKTVFQVLEKQEYLSGIVKKMKEAHCPTPALAQISPLDGDFKVFISYRWKDEQKKFVDNLFNDLNGIPQVKAWKDDRAMKPGANLTPEIMSNIESSDLFLCVLSTDYFESEWCKNELKHAIKHGKKLFPIEWVGKFSLPNKFESQLKDILRCKYDPEAINENAETRKCVNEVISVIGNRGIKRRQDREEEDESSSTEESASDESSPPRKRHKRTKKSKKSEAEETVSSKSRPERKRKHEDNKTKRSKKGKVEHSGRIPETVHEIQDLRKVLVAGTYKLAKEWYDLGQALGIEEFRLNQISADKRGETRACLNATLQTWIDTGSATLEKLAEAVADPAFINNEKLSKEIKEKYLKSDK